MKKRPTLSPEADQWLAHMLRTYPFDLVVAMVELMTLVKKYEREGVLPAKTNP